MKKQQGAMYGCVFLILLFIIFQCSFKDPAAPSWSVPFIVPLMDETYTMEELIEDEDDFFVGQGQTIYYHVEQEFDKLGINDFMTIGEIDTTGDIPIFPQLKDTAWRELNLNESMIVDTAILKSGTMDLAVTNRTNKEIDLAIILPFLFLAGDNKPYILHKNNMAPGQTIRRSNVDLSGALLHPKIENGKNVVQYGIYAVLPNSETTFYKDAFVELSIRDMVLQRFRGGLDELTVNLDTQRDTLDLPEELDGMKFGPVDATLEMLSSFESIPGAVDFIIRGIREGHPPVSIMVDQVEIQTGGSPITLENVSDIINLYPEYIEFEGVVSIGQGYDEDNPVIVNYDDYLLSKARINVPLIFEFVEGWINETEVDTLDLNDEDDEKENGEEDEDNGGPQTNEIIRDNVISAGIAGVAENHFPFGARLTLIFSKTRADSTIYAWSHSTYVQSDSTEYIVKEVDLTSGTTGGGAGTGDDPNVVVASSINSIDLSLNQKEVRLFESPEVYIGTRLEFYPTNKLVKVFPSDYLRVKIRIEAKLNTKIPEDDDEEEEGGEK
ncbi:hypothetical protein JW835_00075 [bacterium]|nr:hypothetical protein [bacterium]